MDSFLQRQSMSTNRSLVRFDETVMYEEIPSQMEVHMRMSPKKFSNSTPTGKSVTKVRWLQDGQNQLIPDPFASEYFVSGSAGEPESDISLWRLNVDSDEHGEPVARVDRIKRVSTLGNTTDMVALDNQTFAITTSKGSFSVYKASVDDQEELRSMNVLVSKQLHHTGKSKLSGPATALAANLNSIVTVGEDGSIVESSATSYDVVRRLDNVDPLSLYAVTFVGRSEILTGNGGGQLKLWDLRSKENVPIQTMNPNVFLNNLYGAVSIAQHPSQSHLIIVGYQSGCMDLFDLRQGSGCDPVANLANDGGSLSEMYFHRINPDHFFSCAQSGQVCHWYPGDGDLENMQDNADNSPDLNIEFLKRGLVFKELYVSPFPVNSMSLSKNDRLVCGGDNGIVFCTEISVNN